MHTSQVYRRHAQSWGSRMAGRATAGITLPLLLLLLAAVAAGGSSDASSKPTPWPEQFHAEIFINLTKKGGSLQITDLWYDWPRRRNLNLNQMQLEGRPLYDVEWNNGTSYYFTRGAGGTCLTRHFPVGVLPPDWLVAGSNYLGRRTSSGFLCDVWEKVDFVWYYEDVVTKRPVRWDFFDGMTLHVITFEVGKVLEDSEWQAPEYCFTGDNGGGSRGDAGDIELVSSRHDVVDVLRHLNLLSQM